MKLKSSGTRKILKSEKGMAILEAVSLLVVFVVLISYGLGYWGAIHTATLHSISSRTYAFETFRNRANTVYFRDNNQEARTNAQHFASKGFRFHGITTESPTGKKFEPTRRPIAFGRALANVGTGDSIHNQRVYEITGRNREGGVEVNPIWIKVGYGLCVNANCGGDL